MRLDRGGDECGRSEGAATVTLADRGVVDGRVWQGGTLGRLDQERRRATASAGGRARGESRRRETAERRRKVVALLARRVAPAEMAKLLDISLATIERDVSAIRQEARATVTTEDVLDVAAEVENRFRARTRELWALYTGEGAQGKPGIKLGILRELRAADAELVAILQSLGIVYRVPARFALDVRLAAFLAEMPEDELNRLATTEDPVAFRNLLTAKVGPELADGVLGMIEEARL